MGRLFGLGGENTMRFTSDELMFITSMTKGPIPFGIFFEKRRGTKAKEAAIAARQALIEKGILSEDGITKKGFAVIKLWEDYRNARKHLVVANNVIGILNNRRCVVIVYDENGFEIASGDSSALLLGFIKSYPALGRADRENGKNYTDTTMDYETFRKLINESGREYFTIGVFPANRQPGEERIIFWNDECFNSYNPHKHTLKYVEPSAVRRFIVDALDLHKEVAANGR